VCDIIEQDRIYVISRCQNGPLACIEQGVVLCVIVGVPKQDVGDGDLEEGESRLARSGIIRSPVPITSDQ
jgi:hypothetical protein